MPHRVASALTCVAAIALPVLAGCGGGAHAPATTAAAVRAPTPPDPHAPLTLQAAEQVLRIHGYSGVVRTEQTFRPRRPFKVLVGIREMAADVPGFKAFFFVGDRFVGTDTPDVSAEIWIVRQHGDAITLRYVLYRPPDGMSTPYGGYAQVTYRWDGRRVVPLGRIPSSVWGAALSRR
jgi:LppP/LprE lipoprotein